VNVMGSVREDLLKAATEALGNAYVRWGVGVGAAVLGEDGRVYEGCNVETCISGLGTCAERCAVDHAVLHGNRKVKMLAVVVDASGDGDPTPCGACLQYVHGFAEDGNLEVVMGKVKRGKVVARSVRIRKLRELFPFPYET